MAAGRHGETSTAKILLQAYASGATGILSGRMMKLTLFLPDNRDEDRAAARFNIAFQVKNLLPRAQNQFPVPNRNRKRGAKHSCLQMRMAVTIVPGLFMPVGAAGWKELVENCWQILL